MNGRLYFSQQNISCKDGPGAATEMMLDSNRSSIITEEMEVEYMNPVLYTSNLDSRDGVITHTISKAHTRIKSLVEVMEVQCYDAVKVLHTASKFCQQWPTGKGQF